MRRPSRRKSSIRAWAKFLAFLILTGCICSHPKTDVIVPDVILVAPPDHIDREAELSKQPEMGTSRAQLPVNLTFDCSFPELEREVVVQAALYWNEQLGFEAFKIHYGCGFNDALLDTDHTYLTISYISARLKSDEKTEDGKAVYILAHTVYGSGKNPLFFVSIVFFKDWEDKETFEAKQNTARHELGHVLGMRHWNNKGCTMYPYIEAEDYLQELCHVEVTVVQRTYGGSKLQETK
ncbi:MAG: matrixin family metalloprotease [Acidiferrobacterales bacterium]